MVDGAALARAAIPGRHGGKHDGGLVFYNSQPANGMAQAQEPTVDWYPLSRCMAGAAVCGLAAPVRRACTLIYFWH